MRQRDEVFSNLDSEQIVSTLEACSLEDKQKFTEDESARIEYCRSLIEQGKTYKQVAAQFRKQDKLKQTGEIQADENALEMSELLALASEQVGTRISLIEAGKILAACQLPDKEQYTGVECEVFVEACTLAKQQGKTYKEVAAHFGVAQVPDDSPERQQLLAQVQNRVQSSMTNLSSTQALQMKQALGEMSIEQLEALQLQFLIALDRELREYVESGQMQAEFQAAADRVIKQPFLTWSPTSDAHTKPLNGNRDRKSLPGS